MLGQIGNIATHVIRERERERERTRDPKKQIDRYCIILRTPTRALTFINQRFFHILYKVYYRYNRSLL